MSLACIHPSMIRERSNRKKQDFLFLIFFFSERLRKLSHSTLNAQEI